MILLGFTLLVHAFVSTYAAVKWRTGFEDEAPYRLLALTLATAVLFVLYLISFVLVLGDLNAGG